MYYEKILSLKFSKAIIFHKLFLRYFLFMISPQKISAASRKISAPLPGINLNPLKNLSPPSQRCMTTPRSRKTSLLRSNLIIAGQPLLFESETVQHTFKFTFSTILNCTIQTNDKVNLKWFTLIFKLNINI